MRKISCACITFLVFGGKPCFAGVASRHVKASQAQVRRTRLLVPCVLALLLRGAEVLGVGRAREALLLRRVEGRRARAAIVLCVLRRRLLKLNQVRTEAEHKGVQTFLKLMSDCCEPSDVEPAGSLACWDGAFWARNCESYAACLGKRERSSYDLGSVGGCETAGLR